MPPMERDAHEKLLDELLTGEIEISRKTEILQELRADYSNVLSDFEEINTSNAGLKKDNDDLVLSNSKLFRQLGVVGNTEKQEEVKEKEFSETITLEALENK